MDSELLRNGAPIDALTMLTGNLHGESRESQVSKQTVGELPNSKNAPKPITFSCQHERTALYLAHKFLACVQICCEKIAIKEHCVRFHPLDA